MQAKEQQIFSDVKIKFIDAGHLLGSASIEVTVTENGVTKTIVFSGDIGNTNRPLIRDPKKPTHADYLVIESTYGNRVHGERKDYVSQLTEVIESTLCKGGNVVIPSFAIGRTQELLYLIHEIKERDLVKNHDGFEVWIDSPLAVEATKIYAGDMTRLEFAERIKEAKTSMFTLPFWSAGTKLRVMIPCCSSRYSGRRTLLCSRSVVITWSPGLKMPLRAM